MHPRYAASGHLIYAQGGDPDGRALRSPTARDHGHAGSSGRRCHAIPSDGASQYSFSDTGSLVYVLGDRSIDHRKLVWVNRNGKEQPLAAPAHAYRQPRISPDGRRVAVGIAEQESQIWLYDLSRDTLTRFTFRRE